MEANRSRYPQGGNELPPIDQTLDFVRGFAYGNTALEALMREYVFETRVNYLDRELRDEANDKIGMILIGIAFSFIKNDIDEYKNGINNPRDIFRNYMVLERRTENPEINDMLNKSSYMATLEDETMEAGIEDLITIWEENHPGQDFIPYTED